MRKVLFFSYFFPPVAGAGVQRSVKFCRYLPQEGFVPIVVAGPAVGSGRWEPEDPELGAELGSDLVVYRPESTDHSPYPTRIDKILSRQSPRHQMWSRSVLELGAKAIAEERPDAIYVSLSPYGALSSAVQLARHHALPLVADLRDPWAFDEVIIYPSGLHRRIDIRRMHRWLSFCDLVLWNTPEALRVAQEAFSDIGGRFACVQNGYDANDFAQTSSSAPHGRFRIVHTGYLHSELFGLSLSALLGGSIWPVDFRGRSHHYLIKALELLAIRDKDLHTKLEVLLVGSLSQQDKELIDRSRVSRCFSSAGYMDHARTVQTQVGADLLFLPMHGLPKSCRSRIVPAKTYEYLASGRPILAAVPEGDARDLVLASGNGWVVAPSDVAGIASAISNQMERKTAFTSAVPPPGLERRALTRKLADHMKAVLSDSSRRGALGRAKPR